MSMSRPSRTPATKAPASGVTLSPRATAAGALEADEEKRLARRLRKGDRAAFERLFTSQLPMLEQLVRMFHRSRRLAREDLYQQGALGLVEGVRRFDPAKGFRLSTYAAYWVRAFLFDEVHRQRSELHIASRRLLRVGRKAERERARASALHGEGAAVDDAAIAAAVGVSVKTLQSARSAHVPTRVGLDAPSHPRDDATLGERLPHPDADPEQVASSREQIAAVRDVLAKLDLAPRDALLLHERIASDDPASLATLGRRAGLSRERMRQLEVALVKRLRTELTRASPDLARAS